MTQVSALIAAAANRLAVAGVPSPQHDARELAAHSLGVEWSALWTAAELGPDFDGYVARRAGREPLQHITGRAYFRHLTLAVGPGVFVPRPETEVVAQAAIDEALRLRQPTVVDLCTGSGAIALSVAGEVAGARVHAVEISPEAHEWAARNCRESDVDLRLGDAERAFPELDATVDIVISNPPYIPLDCVPVDAEVRDHDPAIALWSGRDGLDAVRMIERAGRRLLRPGGLIVVEHADAQGVAVPAVFTAAGGWADVADHRDLADRPRYVTARLSPEAS